MSMSLAVEPDKVTGRNTWAKEFASTEDERFVSGASTVKPNPISDRSMR